MTKLYARVQDDGRVIQILTFYSEMWSEKDWQEGKVYAADIIAQLVECDETVKAGMYYLDGKFLPEKPGLEYVVVDGKWVEDPALKAKAQAEQSARQASAYLNSTDWYVIRKAEKSTEIPAEVTAARDGARTSIDSAEAIAPGIKGKLQGAL